MCTAAPYWVEKPKSQNVGENDSVTFHCRGDGIPEPSVTWLVNGVPITSEFTYHTYTLYFYYDSGVS